MGKQTCNVYKRVSFTIIVERVNRLCQMLNLLDSETLYQVSIKLFIDAFFPYMISYLADKNGEVVRASKLVL